MKKLLSILSYLLLVFTSSLYSQVVWDRDYPSGYCQKMVETEDGGYFAISAYTYVKITSGGDTIFTHKSAGIKESTREFKFCAYLNDGLIAVAYTTLNDNNSAVCILDKGGKILRTKKFTNTTIIKDMVNIGGEMYLSLYGVINGIISLNSLLVTGWTWDYNSPDALEKLCISNEKNIVAITNFGFLVGIYSNTGKTAFNKKTFTNPYLISYQTSAKFSLYQHKDYYYLLHRNLSHTKISLKGDSISTKELFNAGEYDNGLSIPDDNGFTFLYLSRTNNRWNFVKTNENYQVMDSTSFDIFGGYKTTCIILKDTFGHYLLGGNTARGGFNMRILKYKTSELTNTVSALESNVSCYYNQELEKIMIKSEKQYENMKVEIFNASGALISSKNFYNEQEFSISTSGYYSGIYLLRVSTNGNILSSSKIVVR